MSAIAPRLRRGQVISWLRESYGIPECQTRKWIQNDVIRHYPKKLKDDPYFFSRDQILKDVLSEDFEEISANGSNRKSINPK